MNGRSLCEVATSAVAVLIVVVGVYMMNTLMTVQLVLIRVSQSINKGGEIYLRFHISGRKGSG